MERQLLNAFLAIAAVSADSGLLVVNRFTLSCNAPVSLKTSPLLTILNILAGTYKFPFPVTASLIQNFVSLFVIILAECLTSLLRHLSPPVLLDSDRGHLLGEDEELQPRRAVALRRRSLLRKTAVHQCLRSVFWTIIPVAIIYYAKVVLGNVFLTYVCFLSKKKGLADMIRAQPLAVTYLYSATNCRHPLVYSVQHFFRWRLAFRRGIMLPDCSNFGCGPGDGAAVRPKRSGFVTRRLVINS